MDIARTLTAAVAKDDGWYVARCLEVEVASQGETVDEALANPREALELYFRGRRDAGNVRPPARDADRDPHPCMSPALPQVSGRQVVRALERAGFAHVSTKGSHAKLRHADGRVVIVPLHREVRRGTPGSILLQARLSGAELVELLR